MTDNYLFPLRLVRRLRRYLKGSHQKANKEAVLTRENDTMVLANAYVDGIGIAVTIMEAYIAGHLGDESKSPREHLLETLEILKLHREDLLQHSEDKKRYEALASGLAWAIDLSKFFAWKGSS